MLQQIHIPNEEKTDTNQQFGWYTLGDFIAANWFYITAVVVIALIVLMYSKRLKRERLKRQEEARQNANESSTNR